MSGRVIWKYSIPISARSTSCQHSIPAGSRFLACGLQRDEWTAMSTIALWYEVADMEAVREQHDFELFGTGIDPIPDDLAYLGTVQVPGRLELVLHVYENQARAA